jgi:predicted amidophosphoribosyltransferase
MSQQIKCPTCHRDIKVSSKFCKYCGETLKRCPNCREFNQSSDRFCANCGEDISKVETPEPLKREPAQRPEPVIQEIPPSGAGEGQPRLILWPPAAPQTL